jgi:hypothetical protein
VSNHTHRTAVRKAAGKSIDYTAKNAARRQARRDKPKPLEPRHRRHHAAFGVKS